MDLNYLYNAISSLIRLVFNSHNLINRLKDGFSKITYLLNQNFDYRMRDCHVQQLYHWDCGVACIEMLSKYLSKELCVEELYENKKPLWTIEIFLFLKMNSIKACMWTSCPEGISAHHLELQWYRSHNDDFGSIRVCYDVAHRRNWLIHKGALSSIELSMYLQSGAVAIVLVNSLRLQNTPPPKDFPNESAYEGHYILVFRYDAVSDSFRYLDPAADKRILSIASETLQHARSHPGTDFDVIVCEQ